MKLYDFPLSGNAYKARLLLSLANIEHKKHKVDLANGEQKTKDFLAINPAGQVPALTDDDLNIVGSHGILTYLANSYAPQYLVDTPQEKAQVIEWLGYVVAEINPGVATTRLIKLFKADLDYDKAKVIAVSSLEKLNLHLTEHDWLVANKPTIADIAVYPYVRHAKDGDISLLEYTAVLAWIERFETLPGYVTIEQ